MRATSAQIIGADRVAPTLGLAVSDSLLLAFDATLQQILVVADSYVVKRIGREGDGPGEFRAPRGPGSRILPRAAIVDWIAAMHGGILAFDGRRLQRLAADGAYVEDIRSLETVISDGLGPMIGSRLRVSGETVLFDVETQGRVASGRGIKQRELTIWALSEDAVPQRVLTVPLQELPRTDKGGVHLGVGEAMPLWDLHGRCVVAHDGRSGHLIVQASGVSRKVSVILPEREASEIDDPALLARLGVKAPPPTWPKRVTHLIAGGDGTVWLQPVQPPGLQGIEVIRVRTDDGRQRTDTVPHFPRLFLSPTSYIGLSRDALGRWSVHRVNLD